MPARYPRQILMTADTVGGVWTYALELVRALAPFGTQVALATMGAPLREYQWQQAAALPNLTIHESTYKLEWMDEPWADVAEAGQWLLRLAAAVQPDLVHLNGLVQGHLPWGRPVVVVVHSCVLSWWRAVKDEDAPAAWDTYRDLVDQSLRAADVVVAPTRAMLQEARRLYGPFKQQQVICNGRSPQLFRPTQSKEPFIFSMGRVWDEAKNLDLLAQVAAALPWPVYIAGDNRHPATGQLLELPNVHFLGPLPALEAAAWLARAAIYVLPARYEPFGLTILEAALAGCALVIGDIASLREVWGEAAVYVPPASSQELRMAVERLISNEAERNSLAYSASQRAQQYTAGAMARAYSQLYSQLLTVPDEATISRTQDPTPIPPLREWGSSSSFSTSLAYD